MDPSRFDSLSRSLATAKSRRGFLGSLAALGAGLLGARSVGAEVTQAQCGNKTCKSNPGVCAGGCVCCVYGNGNSRCRPPGECSPGTEVGGATTTTAAPATTTTSTTTAEPTTTTTTAAPCAGACSASQGACIGACCGGSSSCLCIATTEGTFCANTTNSSSRCAFCVSDADCVAEGGGVCRTVVGSDCGCGNTTHRACLVPCPAS